MNKKSLFLTALFTISTTQSMLPTETNQQSAAGWSTLCKSYVITLFSGGLIGAITGGLSTYALYQAATAINTFSNFSEQQKTVAGIITFIAAWSAENRLRTTFVNETNQSFEENKISYRKNLTADIAWIASWVAFLAALQMKSNSSFHMKLN